MGLMLPPLTTMLRNSELGMTLGSRILRAWHLIPPCSYHQLQQPRGLHVATEFSYAPNETDSFLPQCSATSTSGSALVVHSTAEAGGDLGLVSGTIDLIAGLQEVSGLPWWAAISLTAVGVRCAMFPLTWQQMRATAANMPLLHQAITVAAQSVSGGQEPGKTRASQFLATFRALRQQHQTPHPSWMIAAPLAQLPVFVTAVMAVRRMAAGSWPGFEAGGLVWFQDLTQPALQLDVIAAPLGSAGAIMPLTVAGLMLANLHIAFGRIRTGQKGSITAWMISTLRLGLEWLTLPLFVIAMQLPQGALVYWTSSASMALAQSMILRRASVRQLLGLPVQGTQGVVPATSAENADAMERAKAISQVQDTQQLFLQAADLRADGDRPAAIQVLQRITELEPGNARAWFALGQTFGGMKAWPQAEQAHKEAAHLEEDSSQEARCWFGAGVAISQQGKDRRAAFEAFGEAASLALKEAEPAGPGLGFAFTDGRLYRVPRPAALPAAGTSTGVHALMSQASMLNSRRQFADAIRLLQRAAGFDPKLRLLVDKQIAALRESVDERTDDRW